MAVTRDKPRSRHGGSDGLRRGLPPPPVAQSSPAMSPTKAGADPLDPGAEVVVVVWPELRGQFDRAGGLAAELAAAAEARAALTDRLEAALEVRRESLRQGAVLGEMRRRLELQRRRGEEAVVSRRRALVGIERRKEQLQAQIERVLPLSRAIAAAHRQVHEAKEVLSGEKARLEDLQRLLRMRQQCMIGQVAALYPVRVFHDLLHTENHRVDANGGKTLSGEHGTLSEENGTLSGENGNGTHLLSVIKSPQVRPLTFFDWQIVKYKRKQKSFSDKELQRSAAVLGYAVHAVLLIASYLDVPLRYPLRFGGSRSYVSDCLPSEHPSVDSTDSKQTEYPLFLECQEDDSTKASYAIYLLHKDTEQLLNYIRAESSERHVFGNLRELIGIIQSDELVPPSERGLAMGVEAKHDTLCIKKVLRSSIRISYRCATEHWVLFSLVLLLYLLYGSSPGFFAFVLSSSPVIICATLLLGVLLSYGSTNLPEFDEDGKDNQEQESKDPFSIKDNKGNEYADSCHNVHQSRVDGKETTFGLSPSSENDREDGEVVEKANQDKVLTDSQSDEVREVSEDKPAEKSGGTCKWGRAFSVRQRKKLADIKIEDINAAVENRLDSSVGSPFARLGSHESHDRSSGFDSDKAESSSPDTSMTDIAPVLHKIDPLLGADFPSPDVIANDDSGGYSNFCPQDSQIDSDSNDEADISQAKNDAKDGEEKEDDCNEHAFLWTDDDEKNVMDLGYAEVERNRRLEILMAKRRSRKNIRFDINRNLIDLDGNDVSGSADGFSCFPIQVPRTNPFDLPSDSDEAAIPGSAPSIRHPQKNPFDLPSEQSNDSGVPAHHNFDPQELTKVSHRDVFFRRHASFNFGSQERHLTRFKPYFVLEPMDFEEVSTSNFQRQFSDKSVSKLSVVTESDTISSVADQEDQNDLIKKDFLSEHASPDLLRQESDLGYVGSKCQDGINFVDHETLNAVTSRMESEPVGNTAT